MKSAETSFLVDSVKWYGGFGMIRDDYALKIDEDDLKGRKQVWLHIDGQTLFINVEEKGIHITAWLDRPMRKKVFKLDKESKVEE